MTSARTPSSSAPVWCLLVAGWSLVFAAPHFYWASGGRAGLGTQAAAADAALQQTWFAAYNLAAGFLGLIGALLAWALTSSWGGPRMRRWLTRAAVAAAVVLLLRGLLGLTLLAVSMLQDRFDPQTPAILLAIEPWFVLGGLVYWVMALTQRRGSPHSS
ncbi:MAG: hypothetical protein AVDCRST_MAG75-2493 [uncultured Propionibacteriaceae bacterium]|uniref:DUF3995 domain-containing protein n=1 Tax=uncultured Propionibacteriaceae bacterium TaxID=257457 RepID=A0A6J4P7U0_9ACTN|nr:MAG: hypothetical protein AVDCRST_MAG75-2493 [uncultured Propionibacteriaceae bacterium]